MERVEGVLEAYARRVCQPYKSRCVSAYLIINVVGRSVRNEDRRL